MIEQTISVKKTGGLTQSFPFNGDPNGTWKCRIVDSNLGVDGDPKVNFVRGGMIDMTFLKRQLGMELVVIFYQENEKVKSEALEVKKSKEARIISTAILKSNVFPKTVTLLKSMGMAVLMLIIGSIILATIGKFVDTSGFKNWWKEFNMAGGSEILEEFVDDLHASVSDPFYDLPGVIAVGEELGVSFRDILTRVDEDIYIMRDVFVDSDDNPIAMEHGELEERCEAMGGYILDFESQLQILPSKKLFAVNYWKKYPEWTSRAAGFFSDNYMINKKQGETLRNSYTDENGKMWGDAEDVLAYGRCGILRMTFLGSEDD